MDLDLWDGVRVTSEDAPHGFHQYDSAMMMRLWAVAAERGVLNDYPYYPRVGRAWLVIMLDGRLRSTSSVVKFDPESGVVVTQNSVYVRG